MEKNIKNIGNKINKGEMYLHPNTLWIYENSIIDETQLCPTKYYINNDNILDINKKHNCKDINSYESRKFMLYPSTVIVNNNILKIYNIVSFDDLFDKVKDLIKENNTFITINRIINCWIRNNYDDLKNKNKILISIYKFIFNEFNPKFEINDSELSELINNWFNSHTSSNFNLNLGKEIIKNLNLSI
jgi:hypothetical protein